VFTQSALTAISPPKAGSLAYVIYKKTTNIFFDILKFVHFMEVAIVELFLALMERYSGSRSYQDCTHVCAE
jgi:hypothetical protein